VFYIPFFAQSEVVAKFELGVAFPCISPSNFYYYTNFVWDGGETLWSEGVGGVGGKGLLEGVYMVGMGFKLRGSRDIVLVQIMSF